MTFGITESIKVPIRTYVRRVQREQLTNKDNRWDEDGDIQCFSSTDKNRTTVKALDKTNASRKTWSTTYKKKHAALAEVGAQVEIDVVVFSTCMRGIIKV